MSKHLVGLLLMLLALSRCGKQGDTIISSGEIQKQITVTGQATIQIAPDIARAQLGVQTFAVSLDEAISENNRRASAASAVLKAGGVAEADIKTAVFQVHVQRDYKEDRVGQIVGYWVNNAVSVTLRDLTRVGQLLQATIEAGINSVDNLVFTLNDFEPVRSQVRVLAMQDARRRAETLAQTAGVELGQPIRIDELGFGGPIYQRASYDAGREGAGAVPVEGGQLEVTAQVNVVFEIR